MLAFVELVEPARNLLPLGLTELTPGDGDVDRVLLTRVAHVRAPLERQSLASDTLLRERRAQPVLGDHAPPSRDDEAPGRCPTGQADDRAGHRQDQPGDADRRTECEQTDRDGDAQDRATAQRLNRV